jgi:RHS repeat-associated protein
LHKFSEISPYERPFSSNIDHREYFPYGEVWVNEKAINEDDYDLPYKYTGKEYDEETKLTYYGARYYDAQLSRWISVDPPLATGAYIGNDPSKLPGLGGVFNPINLNGYQYAGMNPIKYTDADGNFVITGTVAVVYAASYGVSLLITAMAADAVYSATTGESFLHSGEVQSSPKGEFETSERKKDNSEYFYRGASVQDLKDLKNYRVIRSKAERSGANSKEIIAKARAGDLMRKHSGKSTGSPFVSLTKDFETAKDFANGGDDPSGVVLKIKTNRAFRNFVNAKGENEYLVPGGVPIIEVMEYYKVGPKNDR